MTTRRQAWEYTPEYCDPPEPWYRFYVRFFQHGAGTRVKGTQRTLQSCTDEELAWVIRSAETEQERRAKG